MKFEEYIHNEIKSFNLKFLSEETRNFIPEFSGNFMEDKKFFSPVVMKIVAENQLSLTELEKIPGTGRSGRVTKKDVLRYISQNENSKSYDFIESGDLTQESKVISSNEEEMSHMRQMISRHMIDSLSTSAHVHVMTDVDMSRIVEFVRMNETAFKIQESYNLTYTPFE